MTGNGLRYCPLSADLAHQHGADWKAFETAVRDRYFAGYKTNDYNKGKLANNTKLSLRAYGLISEKDTVLTEVGQVFHDLHQDKAALYEAFGRHILKHCRVIRGACHLLARAARLSQGTGQYRGWWSALLQRHRAPRCRHLRCQLQ